MNKRLVTKLLVMLSSLTPLLVATTSCVPNPTTNKNPNIENDILEEQFTADDFFPKLYASDYYNYVEFDHEAKPVIGDKFIMKVINDVVARVSSSKGEIKFSVSIFSDQIVDFNFEWIYLNLRLHKTYSFDINPR